MHRDVGDGVAAEVCAIADADVQGSFLGACRAGSLPLVCELLSLSAGRRVNVHADGEEAFRTACEYGHMDVVRELEATT